MKYLGLILLVTATTLSGIISTYKLKKRVVVAGDLITVCELSLIEMRYSVPTQQELFRILENCDCIRDLNFFEENGRIIISSKDNSGIILLTPKIDKQIIIVKISIVFLNLLSFFQIIFPERKVTMITHSRKQQAL